MIEVKYKQRLGNNIFQYCFGRILADKLGYSLKAKPMPLFPNTSDLVQGKLYLDNKTALKISDGNSKPILQTIKDHKKCKIILDGYFQDYNFYKKYKNVIRKKWLITTRRVDSNFIHPDDVLVCIRRTDYVPNHALPMSYYEDALSKIHYRKIYIVSDDYDSFVALFRFKHKAEFLSYDRDTKFLIIKSFSQIIISNSTYYWWAAFLSKAKKIIAPLPLRGYWSKEWPQINLVVDDEKGWTFIKCKSPYLKSNMEKVIDAKRLLRLYFDKSINRFLGRLSN